MGRSSNPKEKRGFALVVQGSCCRWEQQLWSEPLRNGGRGGSWCSTAGAELERSLVPRTIVIFPPGWHSLEQTQSCLQGLEILEREGELTAEKLDGRKFIKLTETLVAVCARY